MNDKCEQCKHYNNPYFPFHRVTIDGCGECGFFEPKERK